MTRPATHSVKKQAKLVQPGDVIKVPGIGFRTVTETEFNLVDSSVVFTCGHEDVIHEVRENTVVTVYGTLRPGPVHDRKYDFKVATFLACVLVFALVLGVVIGQ